MKNGCPADQFTSLAPRLDLEDRFQTRTFKFPNEDFVYIQCDVVMCDLRVPNDPECQSTCRKNPGLRLKFNFLAVGLAAALPYGFKIDFVRDPISWSAPWFSVIALKFIFTFIFKIKIVKKILDTKIISFSKDDFVKFLHWENSELR